MANLSGWWHSHTNTDIVWLTIGLTGQSMFSIRWVAQWLASERRGMPVVPELFWYLSFTGGIMVLAYGIYRTDPVIILGQFGLLIYARNLFLIWKSRTGFQVAAE